MIEWLQSHEKYLMYEKLFLMDEQSKWLLEIESTLGEDAVKTVEMTGFGEFQQLSQKQQWRLRGLTRDLEVLWVKRQTVLHTTEKS